MAEQGCPVFFFLLFGDVEVDTFCTPACEIIFGTSGLLALKYNYFILY